MNIAIDHDRQALLGILATLLAMAGLSDGRAVLPRRLRNAVLRLLRPAEAATRRLAIALARGLAVTLAAPRLRLATPSRRNPAVGRTVDASGRALHSTGIIWPPGMAPPAEVLPLRALALPLVDPLRNPFARRPDHVPPHRVPRISVLGFSDPRALVPPPTPDDLLDARRLGLRLAALGEALDDLPKQALRFARWQARQTRARDRVADGLHDDGTADGMHDVKPAGRLSHQKKRRWPLRPGRPPGTRRRRRHEVHDILAHAHELAVWALHQPDTS
jgi:hypothetical protein